MNLTHTISSGESLYQATNNIESTSIIQQSATVKYEAGNSINLKPGFEAHAGSQFHAIIENFNCVMVPNPINLAAWTNFACIGGGLNFNITNATNYSVKIYSIAGPLVYSANGAIVDNFVTVWSASGVAPGTYIANIIFSSPHDEISNSYSILVMPCKSGEVEAFGLEDNQKSSIVLYNFQETNNNQFDFSVYPNPNDGNFTIRLIEVEEMKPYSVQIFNPLGVLISKIEHCNTYQINVNHTNLPLGIYFIKLTMGNKISTKKIVIQ